MSVSIRRAVEDDAELVRTMLIELAMHQEQGEHVTASADDWRRFLKRDDVVVMIAEIDERAAGYVSALRRPYLWGGEDLLALDDLYVRAQFRDAGVGRALVSSWPGMPWLIG